MRMKKERKYENRWASHIKVRSYFHCLLAAILNEKKNTFGNRSGNKYPVPLDVKEASMNAMQLIAIVCLWEIIYIRPVAILYRPLWQEIGFFRLCVCFKCRIKSNRRSSVGRMQIISNMGHTVGTHFSHLENKERWISCNGRERYGSTVSKIMWLSVFICERNFCEISFCKF